MTAGTAVIMWLGELVTDRGIGNGMSILIFTQVVATFPASLWAVQSTNGWWVFRSGHGGRPGPGGSGHLHGAGAAPHPRPVRPPDGGAQDVRRKLDLHPVEGQPWRASSQSSSPRRLLYLPAMAVQFNPNDGKNPVLLFIADHVADPGDSRCTWRSTSC
jgi:preprotein translocase subunit SecY